MTTAKIIRAAAWTSLAVVLPIQGTHAQSAPMSESRGSASELTEVVVTATRRSEALLDVPVSVSAYTSAALETNAIHDIADLSRLTPGLVFTPDGLGRTNISIRGISSIVGAATTGVYIDDTPIQIRAVGGTSPNTYPAIFDLDRVEVLRGPQGTLFGSGSEGGTIRFLAMEPSLTNRSLYARSEISTTEHGDPTYELGVAAGGPASEGTLGFRVSAFARHDGGWIDRQPVPGSIITDTRTNTTDARQFRIALKYAPNSALSISPSILYQYTRLGDTYSYWPSISDASQGQFRNGYTMAAPNTDHFVLSALKVEWLGEHVSLFSNTSYFDRSNPSLEDYSFFLTELLTGGPATIPGLPNASTPTRFLNAQKIFTQEVRLQSNDTSAPLTGVAGAFYQDTKQDEREEVISPTFPDFISALTGGLGVPDVFGVDLLPGSVAYLSRDRAHDQQLAAFGQFDYKLTSKLTATAGLRVSRAKFDFTNAQDGPFNGGPSGESGSQSETPVTPKFGLTYKQGADLMFYASASKGYRPGGANTPVPDSACAADLTALGLASAPASYNSDGVWSYEVGSKGRSANHRLEFEVSAFDIKWDKIQSSIHLSSCGFGFIANFGAAVSRGADLQASFKVAPDFVVSVSAAYTDAYFTETVASTATLVEKGDKLQTPPRQATVAADYSFAGFATGSRAYIHADVQYMGGYTFGNPAVYGYDPAYDRHPGAHYANLRVGTKFGGWDVALIAKNLTNSHDQLSASHDTMNPGSVIYYTTYRPRTIGITASYRY